MDEEIPFITAVKQMKYLGINLSNVYHLYIKFKTPQLDIKKDLNKQKDILAIRKEDSAM